MGQNDFFELIVVGAGAMGAAAAWHAAQRGLRVLALEQFSIAHDRGSSHGDTRICRRAYFEHPQYVPLADRAYQGWADLESAVGRTLFERVGLIFGGPADGMVVAGVQRAAGLHGVRIETLAPAERARRFGMFRVPDEHVVLHEPDAGFLHVERCVAAFAEAARAAGAEIRPQTRVVGWRPDGDGVCVELPDGVIRGARLIIAAGAWSPRELAALGLPLRVRRKMQLWFPTSDARLSAAAGCPVFGFETAGRFFYGSPSLDGRVLKIAEHTGGEDVVDPDDPGGDLREADVSAVAPFVSAYFPTVEPRPARHSVCMYTMTPDEHFVVDLHPRCPRVALAGGFSGHGFKFAPVIGEALVELVTQGRSHAALEMFRAGRFEAHGRA